MIKIMARRVIEGLLCNMAVALDDESDKGPRRVNYVH